MRTVDPINNSAKVAGLNPVNNTIKKATGLDPINNTTQETDYVLSASMGLYTQYELI